jgi:hypothetical protein
MCISCMESHLKNLEEVVVEAINKKQLPRFLYKYRPLNKFTEAIISDASFWFASADSFNDPFDCNLTEERNIKVSDYEKFFMATSSLSAEVINKYLKKAKRNSSIIREHAIKSREETINSFGLLSLSENFNSILMWSHYAENHTGIVLCLDLLEDPSFFISSLKVNYQEAYNPVNFFSRKADLDYVNTIITTKSKEWEYEQEIRVIKSSVGKHDFKKSLIKKVYFGCKCENAEKLKIKKLFEVNGYNSIKFLESRVSYGKFKLNFRKYT